MTDNNSDLRELAIKWLNRPSFEMKHDLILEGRSGEEYKMDMMIEPKIISKTDEDKLLVSIADIKKSAGTDIIRKIELVRQDLQLKTLLISNKFSVQARSLAKRSDVLLISRSELEACLENSVS